MAPSLTSRTFSTNVPWKYGQNTALKGIFGLVSAESMPQAHLQSNTCGQLFGQCLGQMMLFLLLPLLHHLSECCHNKLPTTRWLTATELYAFSVLEVALCRILPGLFLAYGGCRHSSAFLGLEMHNSSHLATASLCLHITFPLCT